MVARMPGGYQGLRRALWQLLCRRHATAASPAMLTRILADAPVDVTWAENLERMRDDDRGDAVDVWQS